MKLLFSNYLGDCSYSFQGSFGLLGITVTVSLFSSRLQLQEIIRPALSGGMDWWRMEWPFSRVRKIFFRGRIFQQNPGNSAERASFAKFQAPKFEISEPEKVQFHTPSHSIPPLDSLLIIPLRNDQEFLRLQLRDLIVFEFEM